MTRRVVPDGDPTVPAPRSLGRRPGQACSGNDTRLSDARETVQVNGTDVGKRRNINLVAGSNVTLTGSDLPDTDTVNVTVAAAGGGSIRFETNGPPAATYTRPQILFTGAGFSTVTLTDDNVNNKVQVEVATYLNTSLEAISSTTPAANKLPYYSGTSSAATTDLTSFARTLLDDVDAAASRTTLGLAAIASSGSASDLSAGTVATARLGSGTANSSTYLRGDQTWASIPGATGAQGVTTIDFGAFPGASDTSLAITGQAGIDSASVVTAWLQPADTDDHTADEHRVETISVMAGNVVSGVGFTIYATNTSQRNEPLSKAGVDRFRSTAATVYGYASESSGGIGTLIYGKWTVAWKWS